MPKRTSEISKPKLFILELERPQPAQAEVTTRAIGEECGSFIPGKVTTEALGEECFKMKFKRF